MDHAGRLGLFDSSVVIISLERCDDSIYESIVVRLLVDYYG